jgi:catechol 2,3-dioxygenase-like lactoylglutathione lyase family enzyme
MKTQRRISRLLSSALWVLTLSCRAAFPSETNALVGIDHIPLVVANLDEAAETYRRLGFAIKPGHPHPDSIRNEHVKFPDGAGIELITASEPLDETASRYLQMRSQGEGPAYVSFHTGDMTALKRRLDRLGQAYSVHDNLLELTNPTLKWLFVFEGTNQSPTDRPEHFAHPNTADATQAVWIAGGDQRQMLAFFQGLGARIERRYVHVPEPTWVTVAAVANGEVIFLPSSRQLIPGRPIVGVVMHVRHVSAVTRVLQSTGVSSIRQTVGSSRSIFIAPQEARGVWLEFRQ